MPWIPIIYTIKIENLRMKSLFRFGTGERQLLISEDLNKNNFDLLRFLLATSVIYSHCFVLYHGVVQDTEPFKIFTLNQYDLGGVAVSFFFVISGFLIVRSFVHSINVYEYLIKRILRIVPGFFAAFLFSVVIAGYISTIDVAHKFGDPAYFWGRLQPKRLILEIFTFDAPRAARLFEHNPMLNRVNSALWTIQFEVICYLLVPLFGLVAMAQRKWLSVVLFLGSFITLLLQELHVITIHNNMQRVFLLYASELPRLAAAFFAGSVCYFYRDVVPRSVVLATLSVALFLFASWWMKIFNIVMPVAGAYLVFYFAYHPHIRFYDFAKKGDLSYGLYLYGWPIQQMVVHWFYPYLGAHRLFFIAYPLAYIAAFLSWHFLESPFLKKKSQIKKLLARIRKTTPNNHKEALDETSRAAIINKVGT